MTDAAEVDHEEALTDALTSILDDYEDAFFPPDC